MKPDTTKIANAGIRQTMAWVHTWAGLTLGWVLYFMFVTGTAGYFDTEIDRWMQPELPPAQINSDTRATAATLLTRAQSQAPNADQWLLTLPSTATSPTAAFSGAAQTWRPARARKEATS